MKFNVAILKESSRFRKNFGYRNITYTPIEADKTLAFYEKIDAATKVWFENLAIDVMIWWAKSFSVPVPKTPKELKKERGEIMRAKREAKRAAQICS